MSARSTVSLSESTGRSRGNPTSRVLCALVLGILTGWLCHRFLSDRETDTAAHVFSVVANIFLRLIKMVIGPLVLATLISGIAHLREGKLVARLQLK